MRLTTLATLMVGLILITKPGGPLQAAELASDVEFARTGGLAGFDDALNIEPDGSVHLRQGAAWARATPLAPAEVDELAVLLDETGLFRRDQELRSVGADLISYTLRYRGVTVVTDELALPEALRPVIERLVRLLERP